MRCRRVCEGGQFAVGKKENALKSGTLVRRVIVEEGGTVRVAWEETFIDALCPGMLM